MGRQRLRAPFSSRTCTKSTRGLYSTLLVLWLAASVEIQVHAVPQSRANRVWLLSGRIPLLSGESFREMFRSSLILP